MNVSLITSFIIKSISWVKYALKGKVKAAPHPDLSLLCYKNGNERIPEIVMETTLRGTTTKGNFVQAMAVRVRRSESVQDFYLSGYEEGEVYSGGNLLVPEAGIRPKMHFNVGIEDKDYRFSPDMYSISLLAYDERDNERVLCVVYLEITESLAKKMKDDEVGLKFAWQPSARRYKGCVVNVQRYMRT